MKYVILIIDGAAGHPLPLFSGQTSLELAKTPNLDSLAKTGKVGLTCNVPEGMEPSSAVACMSIMGYDPVVYYRGRSAIEAFNMGIDIGPDEEVFRCNLVAIRDGRMLDYSAGHITTAEARELILSIDKALGDFNTKFYPGVGYRHILKTRDHQEALEAVCTPPHDISGRSVQEYLPQGRGSHILRDLMARSEAVLHQHPVNLARIARGEIPATTIWIFWPSGQIPSLPSFRETYGQKAAMISGVDLLRGLARMAKMDVINVAGVTDGLDNDYAAQGAAAISALEDHDLVIIHVEAPDEAGHSGSAAHKVKAIEDTDREIIARLRNYKSDSVRFLILPDHPTPIEILTHTGEPVPFLLCGPGLDANGAGRLTEAEAKTAGFFIQNGYDIIKRLIMESD